MKRLLSISKALAAVQSHMNNFTESPYKATGGGSNHLRRKREAVNHIETVIQVF